LLDRFATNQGTRWHRSCNPRGMPLDRYCFDKRPLTQPADAPAFEALCGLENNHVGAVMVEENGRLVGIVTDRDLALRVFRARVDPLQTPLRSVMTADPLSLPIEASETEAATLMRTRHIRRIPIMAGNSIAGIVTLDDLLMSGGVSGVEAGNIIEAQLREPALAKPTGDLYPMRLPRGRHADQRGQ
jgi:signal-transduction protein with cAMP-binding, CBS, and nucleotidyltransferase domain